MKERISLNMILSIFYILILLLHTTVEIFFHHFSHQLLHTHISYYNYFQMVIEVVDNLNWESPIIFYSQDQDIVLWQDFKSRGFLQPQFIKIPQFDDVAGQKLLKILLGVKHKRASTTLNLILFVDQLHIATAFLQSIEFFCLLFSRKKKVNMYYLTPIPQKFEMCEQINCLKRPGYFY